MTKKKLISISGINIEIDSSLEKYRDIVLFPEKVDNANEMLRTIGLPNDKKNKK